jgi:hypothetical protein
MTQVEKGRFCGSCQKQVVDFSNMSDREIATFFKKPSIGSVCGRFMQDQLERDIVIPKKRIPWVKYFFQFALPAFLISMKVNGQKVNKLPQVKVVSTIKQCTPTMGILALAPDSKKKIVDDTMMVPMKRIFNDTINLPEIVVVSYQQRTIGKLVTNFSVLQVPAKDTNTEPIQTCTIRLGGAVAYRVPVVKSDSFFQNIKKIFFKDTSFKNFKIYPNPVTAGSTITIEWKKAEPGDYDLQLLNLAGQVQMLQQLRADEEMQFSKVQIPAVAAGIYFLRVTNKKTARAYTEKIIVQ